MGKKVVAITSCITGIAHTYMAAEALKKAAAERDVQIHVETQGASGTENALTEEQIREADAIVFACDKTIDESRFAGRKVLAATADEGIRKPGELIDDALAGRGVRYAKASGETVAASSQEPSAIDGGAKSAGKRVFKHVMNGVSHMIPTVVAGGILMALSFVFGVNAYEQEGSVPWALYQMGSIGLGLMTPVLAAFIADSIADRPGFIPGLIGGMIASNIGSGFIGGIFAGLIAGYVTSGFNKLIKLPKELNGLKPILILPILGTAVVGFVMYYLIGYPIEMLTDAINGVLKSVSGGSAILLGVIVALLQFDLGGALSHVQYAFVVGALGSGITAPMAAVMVSGMTPPIGLAISTLVCPKLWSQEERDAGKACLLMGFSFITEGCIPFAAAYPLQIIPSAVIGNIVGCTTSLLLNVGISAPHGGLFLLLIPGVISNIPGWLLALALGSAVTALMITLSMARLRKQQEAEKAGAAA
jgi:PTS system fructose-specific IIC component